ncbi:ATP-binding protein [Shewanella sp. 1_MG-2023]|uniref:ATP-binding protein n=1 Tax=unclassified Shewanella TaxID=196818 RepID=UPI0026E11649|nr:MULTISPECIES: ATP-binding protein [unclassified Shewanella]MDO6613780.1 ATP-binding protein [Shewanella sp. 7_MG-2023]MDO6773518.1 ATP-binding protein [Shewanella sp. 2_MG-2023]MDO6796503.1 ATP-binding protein [Shewanella sp. 1_MG-2023]
MTLLPSINRLFVKLLLGFWLCSSLIIGFVGVLPFLQQNHDQQPLSHKQEHLLKRVAKHLIEEPELLENTRALKKLNRHRSPEGKALKFYILDDESRVINHQKVPRTFREFLLLSEDHKEPISHQFRTELIFGPYTFIAGERQYRVYSRIADNHPKPWFFFFNDHKLLTVIIAMLMSGVLCGLLAWNLGKPLRSLKQSSNALAGGDLSSRVDKKVATRGDEIGELAQAFNSMADAIETMINNQQRLMGDISHELRTPLTRLQLSLALARKKEQSSVEIERIGYEAEQLEDLISELLTLSRVTISNNENKVHLELAESLSQILDDAEFEAEQQQKQLEIDIPESISLDHYPKSLSRAIENVLRNAIRYADSRVTINAVQKKSHILITISDNGPGIDDAELEEIFKPFYRPDSSRVRESGGWGLGLAITQAAIKLNQGEIIASNLEPQGLQLKIRLPLKMLS